MDMYSLPCPKAESPLDKQQLFKVKEAGLHILCSGVLYLWAHRVSDLRILTFVSHCPTNYLF